MPLDAVANFVRGNADGAIADTDTTIDVLSADIFPDPATDNGYNVVIWDADQFPRPTQDPDVEIMRVTGIDTTNDTLTVTRAQEGTIAVSHPNNSAIHLSPTAKMYSDIQTKVSGISDDGTALQYDSGTINRLDNEQRSANVYVYKDGSETVGVNLNGTEIARDTDAGMAFQTVCDSLPAEGGRISVGRGKFVFQTGFTTGVPVEIVGQGMAHPLVDGPTKFKYADDMNESMITVSPDSRVQYTSNTVIENLTIDGENTNNSSGHGVKVDQQPDVQINRVLFWYCPEIAIRVTGGHQELWVTNSWVEHSGDHNIFVKDGYATFISNSYIIDAANINLFAKATKGLSISGCYFDDALTHDNINLQNTERFSIVGNPYLGNADRAGIYVFADGTSTTSKGTIGYNVIEQSDQGIRMDTLDSGTIDKVIASYNVLDGNTTNLDVETGVNSNGIIDKNVKT